MLKHIKVKPIAFESFGVRAMATYVETADVKILLDAGASLAPSRFGLPPHPREYKALAKCREEILKAAEKADIVTISHYHLDHYTPSYTDYALLFCDEEYSKRIYRDKLVFVKDISRSININQKRRGWIFEKTCGKYAKELKVADGRTFEFGSTKLKFSKPVPHGKDDKLGWVLMLTIEDEDEKLMFAPDVQGPACDDALKIILSESPDAIIIGGPPTYLSDFRVAHEDVQREMENLVEVVENVPLTILEHHLLRDEEWRNRSIHVFEAASRKGNSVITASELLGRKEEILEAKRKRLFDVEPPNAEFKKWMKIPYDKRRYVKPPIDSLCTN